MPSTLESADIGNQVNTPPDILFGHVQLQVGTATDCEARQATHRFLGTAGMDGRQRSAMAGIHRVEQCAGLRAAHLADNDAVWPVPKHSFEQVVEGDLAAVSIGLRLC